MIPGLPVLSFLSGILWGSGSYRDIRRGLSCIAADVERYWCGCGAVLVRYSCGGDRRSTGPIEANPRQISGLKILRGRAFVSAGDKNNLKIGKDRLFRHSRCVGRETGRKAGCRCTRKKATIQDRSVERLRRCYARPSLLPARPE